jgi:PAS domain S-box-containing protein
MKESQNDFLQLTEKLPISVSIVTLEGKPLYINPKCRELFEIDPNQKALDGNVIMQWINPGDRQKWIQEIKENGAVQNFELHLTTAKGKEIFAVGNGHFIQYQNQTCIISTHLDITDRILAEKNLKKVTDEYEKVFTGAQNAMFLVKVEGDNMFRYVKTNLAHQKSSGIPLSKIENKTPQQLVGEELGKIITTNYQKCVDENRTISYEEELELPGGKKVWTTSLSPVDEEGKISYIVGSSNDITFLKKIQNDLNQNRENLQHFFNSNIDFLWVLDLNGNIIHINDTVKKRLGYNDVELLGKPVVNVHPPHRRTEAAEIVKRMLEGKAESCPVPLINKQGTEIPVETFIFRGVWDGKTAFFGVSRDISALKLSEEKFQKAFLTSPNIIGLSDMETGEFLEVNDTFFKVMEYTPDEIIGKKIKDLVRMDDKFREIALREMIEKGSVQNLETVLYTKTGKPVDVMLSAEIIELQNKQYNLTTGVVITERKQAENALRESEERFKALHNGSFGGIVIHDKGLIILCNQGLCDISGYTMDELIGMDGLLLISEKSRTMVVEKITSGYEKPYEAIGIRKDGTEFPVRIEARNIPFKGKIVRVTEFRDITEQKKNEAELIDKENRWRTIIKASPDGIVVTDPQGFIVEISDMAYKMYGYQPEDNVIGRNLIEFVDAEYHLKVENEIKELMLGNVDYTATEFRVLKKDGTKFYIEANADIIKDENEKPKHFFFIERDITERKKASLTRLVQYNITKEILTAQSVESLAKVIQYELNRIIDTSNFFIAFYNAKTNRLRKVIFSDQKDDFTEWDAAMSISGQVVKQKRDILLNRASEAEFARDHNIVLQGSPAEAWLGVPIIVEGESYGVMTVQSYTDPDAYDESTVALLKLIAHETGIYIERQKMIEDVMKAKEKAEESDRLKSAFLANMSHEIRTPMNGILGFTDLLKDPETEPESRNLYLDIIEKSGRRLLNLINDLIDISKIEAGQMKLNISSVNIEQETSEIFNFFQIETKSKNIELRLKINPVEKTEIDLDRDKFLSIFTNLVKNAIKFTDQGFIEMGYEQTSKGFIRFFVKDTGRGIPLNKQKHIFKRFAQVDNKPVKNYEGAGLGLAISKAYAEMMGGAIGMTSEPDKGSEFYFLIPDGQNHKEASQNQLANESENTSVQSKNEPKKLKILVAEDDLFAKQYFSFRLKEIARELHFAETGRQTIDFCRSNPDTDLILMDIKMPDIDGLEATRQIRSFNQDIIIIAQTAYALMGDKNRALEAGCNDYLAKPIKKEDLSKTIKKWFEI